MNVTHPFPYFPEEHNSDIHNQPLHENSSISKIEEQTATKIK
jgi:hypothetical protein